MPTTRSKTLIMRMFIIASVLFTACYVNAQSLPDEVVLTYISQNKPLKLVLKELTDKSGVSISFNPNRIPGESKITINAINQSLGVILKSILAPRRCMYEIIGNQINISRIKSRIRDHTISGYLTDAESGENLVGANIYLFDKSKGTQSNEYGFYSMTLPAGVKRLYFSYLGYGQEVKEIYLKRDTVMDIYLTPDAQLNEIIILDDVENQEEPQTVSESRLPLSTIHTASSLGGESDILRLVGMMPGVSSGADGLGGMNVRGGSADQNLVLLDGVPIYNSAHALGVFSVFNSNVIKNATLIKGNIPARHGGRLSSVLDVRTRDGNNKRLSGDVSISALAAKASIEGPIGKNGSSYLFSARRTFLDVWIRSLTSAQNELNGDKGSSSYYFMDLNGKLSLKLNKKHTLYLSSFVGEDNFETFKEAKSSEGSIINQINTRTDWNWGNQLFSAKLVSQYSKKTFGRITAYYTKFNFDSFELDDFRTDSLGMQNSRIYKAGYYKSGIDDISLKYDFDYIPNPVHLLRLGVGATTHNFSPGLVSINDRDQVFQGNGEIVSDSLKILVNEPQLSGQEYFGYIEDEISLGYGSTINLGMRANYTKTGEKSYLNFQPRISFLARWDGAYYKVGVSRMIQYLHLLSSNGLGLPTDVWLPSTDALGPEKSWMATMGVGYYNSNGIRFGIEAYFKLFDALTTYEEGGIEDINDNIDWESNIPVGTGKAYGVEVNFDKIIGRTTWNLNYALAYSTREFEGLNINDEAFPFRYNRRHNVKLGVFHKITDNTEFVANWNLSSGNPITSPDGQVVVNNDGELVVVYSRKNNGLLPRYHRLDVGFNFYSRHSWGRTKLSLGVYNTFNNRNPFYIDIENSPESPNSFQIVEFSILPIIPSVGYSISF